MYGVLRIFLFLKVMIWNRTLSYVSFFHVSSYFMHLWIGKLDGEDELPLHAGTYSSFLPLPLYSCLSYALVFNN